MRQIDPHIVEDRKNRILHAVIHQFIKTAKPVGSNALIEDYGFGLSPATIRNLMADLEEDGYLTHPHTSAGRLPTDKGYRAYVDSILELQRLVLEEEERVRREYDNRIRELHDVLAQTTHVLSGLSHYGGFVLPQSPGAHILKRLELVQMSDKRLLAIMVTNTGEVKHRMMDGNLPADRLRHLSRILNDALCGMNMEDAKRKIIQAIDDAEQKDKESYSIARSIGAQLLDIEEGVMLDGATNVLTLPEFRDYEPMTSLLRLNEEKGLLSQIISEGIKGRDGVNVVIGSETTCKELKNLSVVSSIYRDGDRPVGVLGIIGPKRMDYERMMSLVGAVSRIVSRIIERIDD
jgi:heat-inducible transcriptional repressor